MKLFIAVILCAGILSANAKNVPAEHGNEVSKSDRLAFVSAVKSGNDDRLRELIKDHDVNKAGKHGRNALHYAAENGNEKIVDALLQKGADVNLVDDEGLSPVHFAAFNENASVMDLLIKKGGDINKATKSGNTPTHLAALNCNEKVMELLLNNGANIDTKNDEEETALHWAAINFNEKVPELLIRKGVNVTLANDEKDTALHLSALNSNDKIADLLIKAGANVNAAGKSNWSPVFYAVINGNDKATEPLTDPEDDETYAKKKARTTFLKHFLHPVQEHAAEKIIELLINNGANINQKDSDDGMTPYDVAVTLGDERMKEFLVKHGAKTDN